jgi:2-keto-4-pentenoate hydratase/2-oxohepta-3-ene-1,7-dioic acid hydratase in catechol pathway
MRFAVVMVGEREVPVVVSASDAGRRLLPLAALVPDVLPAEVATGDGLLPLLRLGLDAELRGRIAAAVDAAPAEAFLPATDARSAPPFRHPRMVWGIGLNYRAHADDLGAPHPDEPASFVKLDHTIVGAGDTIELPVQSLRVTAEAELGIVIGRHARDVDEADALDHVAAVCCVLDQTAEDILQRNPRFLTRSKNFPTFLVLGPELVTTDEVRVVATGLNHLEVATWRNGALHRANVVGDMAFDPAALVAFHSRMMPLEPGDLILTGTPGAVVIEDGDVAECRITGVGSLTSPVRRAVSSEGGW